MALLQDVRTMFRRRRKPVEMDFSGTQAEGLDEAVREHDAIDPAPAPVAAAGIEAKPLRVREPRPQDEVLGLVRRIGDHLDGQSARTGRLLDLMDRMPQALDALPEINRQNARLLEALHEHFGQAAQREAALNATLTRITETAGRQTEVLGLVQQQLDANQRTTGRMTETLGTLRQAISDLAESNTRSADVLGDLAESAARREVDLSQGLARTQRWLVAAVIVFGGAAVAMVVLTLTG